MTACADPGIFVRGGVQVCLTKKALTTFFLPSAYYGHAISKKSIIFQGSRGGPTISGGGGGGGVSNFFQGGGVSNGIFLIEKHITCDFPGGVRTPCPPPLDPHLDCISSRNIRVKCLLIFY